MGVVSAGGLLGLLFLFLLLLLLLFVVVVVGFRTSTPLQEEPLSPACRQEKEAAW